MVIVYGIIIRGVLFASGRDFWLDEAFVALNIVQHNFFDLIAPSTIMYQQVIPPFFLLSSKLVADFFGAAEYTLRFIPYLAGCLSLIVFYLLTRKVLNSRAALIAIILMATSKSAIYYAVELKHYSIDLLMTAILVYLAVMVFDSNFRLKELLLLTLAGIVGIWSSITAILVLAGIGLTLLYLLIKDSDRQERKIEISVMLVIGLIWSLNFAVNYFLYLSQIVSEHHFLFFTKGLAPFPPTSLSDLLWYPQVIMKLIGNPIGFKNLRPLILITPILAIYRFLKDNKSSYLLIISTPLIITFLASLLHFYPLHGRLMLFSLPLFYMLIANGLDHIYTYFRRGHLLLGITFLAVMFVYPSGESPLGNNINLLLDPDLRKREEITEVIAYYSQHALEDDSLYVHSYSRHAFDFYTLNQELSHDIIYGQRMSREKNSDSFDVFINELPDGRCWFILPNNKSYTNATLNIYYSVILDTIGVQLDHHDAVGVSIYLYDLDRVAGGRAALDYALDN